MVSAWEERWRGVADAHRPPRPRLIHSNLDSWDSIIRFSECAELERGGEGVCFTGAACRCTILTSAFDEHSSPPSFACRLPERLRPSSFAFGTLADGFLPFSDAPSNGKKAAPAPVLASVVMKCVQARHPATADTATPSALKIGDDEAHVKVGGRMVWDGEDGHACALQGGAGWAGAVVSGAHPSSLPFPLPAAGIRPPTVQ